ncbi:MAG: hypothetical protein RL106_1473 [Bacteroidota bacterium]
MLFANVQTNPKTSKEKNHLCFDKIHFMRILLITLHLLLISVASLFSWEEPTVRQEIPAVLGANGVSVIKVKVNKSDIDGFAMLEINVPDGFTAKAIETKGASFTFSERKMRFVWMNLPDVSHFDITYQLVHLQGSKTLEKLQGVFSFVENNKKKEVAIDNQIINGSVQVNNSEMGEDVIEQSFHSFLNAANDLPACERTVTKKDDEFIVELVLHLNGMKGFLKMQEWASNGCVLSKFQSAGATVTVDGSTIKFVWFEVPAAETVVVKYKLKCASIPEDGLTIDGKLSFTVDNQPREVPIILASQAAKAEAQNTQEIKSEIQETQVQEEKKEVVVEAVGEVKTPSSPTRVSKPDAVKTPESPEIKAKSSASVTSGQSKVSFKVQILANHRSVSEEEWVNKYGVQEEKQVSNHEGWMKWTVGSYSDYKDARGKRESLNAKCPNLPGPFVTAFQDGNRITVQEALMISQQKWIQ